MKNFLLIGMILLLGTILGIGSVSHLRPPGFPEDGEVLQLLKNFSSAGFLEGLCARFDAVEMDAGDIRALLRALDTVSPQCNARDLANADGIRGVLMLKFGYPRASIALFDRAILGAVDSDQKEGLFLLKADAQRKTGDFAGLRETAGDLKALGCDPENVGILTAPLPVPREVRPVLKNRLLAGLIWLLLLVLPVVIVERERRNWLRRFPPGSERLHPFHGFMRSPVGVFLCVLFSIFVVVLGLPRNFGSDRDATWGVIHWLLSYIFVLYPQFLLDREIRGTTWSFVGFLVALLRLNFLKTIHLLVPIGAFFVLRWMAQALPMWPVLSPLGVGLGFPAVCGLLFMLIPFSIPPFMGFKRIRADEFPEPELGREFTLYRWVMSGGKVFNAFAFGFFSPTRSLAVSDDLLNEFSREETAGIIAHEEGHLRLGHLFIYFLYLYDWSLLVGLYAIAWPLQFQKFLVQGPGLKELFIILTAYFVFSRVFSRISWKCELEADAFGAGKIGREPFLSALSRLAEANFHPHRLREGELPTPSHPSIQERKRRLRMGVGEYFEPKSVPAPGVLVALWRGRLALDWKCGEEEAVYLSSLDDSLTGGETEKVFSDLAARHCGFGAEVLVLRGGRGLEILLCAQKSAVSRADPALPHEKVCGICSRGMLKAIPSSTGVTWKGTITGCVLDCVSKSTG